MVSSCVAPRNCFTRFSLVGSIKKKIVDFPSPLCAFSIEISHPLDTSSACDQLLPHEIPLFFARPLSTEEGQSGGISIRRLLSIRPSFLTLERPSCEPVTITRSRRLDDDEDNEMLRECPFCGHFGSVSSSFGRFQSADFNNLNPSAFLMFWTVLPFVSPPQIIFGLLFFTDFERGKDVERCVLFTFCSLRISRRRSHLSSKSASNFIRRRDPFNSIRPDPTIRTRSTRSTRATIHLIRFNALTKSSAAPNMKPSM